MRTIEHRIVFLGAGISHYPNGGAELSALQAGATDVQHCFDAFLRCSGEQLDIGGSLVATNISASQFVAALEVAFASVASKRSLLIVYFSGHATLEENELILQFSDAPNKSGLLSITRFMDLHRTYGWPNVLLILDCCYAGGARISLGWSGKYGAHIHSNISLLASSSPFQRSADGEHLSPFTEAIVKSCGELLHENKKISVRGLISRIQGHLDASQQAEVLIPDGKADITISGKDLDRSHFEKLTNDLLRRFRNGTEFDREALWFSLSEETELLALTVSERCLNEDLSESNWLVRRAIGSTLGNIKYLTKKRDAHLRSLLSSPDWMNVAVALNALKRQPESAKLFKPLASNADHAMDVKWLSLLYASDMLPNSVWRAEEFKKGQFLESDWGLTEVVNHVYGLQQSLTEDVESLLALCSKQVQSNFHWLLQLRYGSIPKNPSAGEKLPANLVDCARSILNQGSRGSMGTSGGKKWLRSKLYGNWRGTITLDLKSSFGTLSKGERISFIEQVPILLPTVNAKMAFLDSVSPEICPNPSSLCWGILDPHPWVRRSYLSYIRRLPDKEAIKLVKSIDWPKSVLMANQKLFPGTLDLLFEGYRTMRQLRDPQGLKKAANFAWKELSQNEEISLTRALRNENIFVDS
ncbi:caspase family protein [Hydrogenophaga soli]